MSRLNNALIQYLSAETKIANSESKELELLTKHKEAINSVLDNCTVEQAEEIHYHFGAVDKHQENIKSSEEKRDEATEIIKEYLVANNNKPIFYIHQNGSPVFPRYLFSLDEKGEVTHNLKNG